MPSLLWRWAWSFSGSQSRKSNSASRIEPIGPNNSPHFFSKKQVTQFKTWSLAVGAAGFHVELDPPVIARTSVLNEEEEEEEEEAEIRYLLDGWNPTLRAPESLLFSISPAMTPCWHKDKKVSPSQILHKKHMPGKLSFLWSWTWPASCGCSYSSCSLLLSP